ncbi:unnamed protein product [Musa acuminata subsp. malaccensis]|uniref:(wild Malaysian banana) hypothetical protein n=1 Tax=Musa acuminata subsp. malaccensis TaxID=214687 RepID=A0A8D7FKU4_MUSAM|nr:unnamed protein product [Musa acuminata subsp. malaccensis]
MPLGRCSDRREEISLSVPSPVGGQRRFHVQFLRRIDWRSLFRTCKGWLKNPMNIALLIWLLSVAVSGTMLGLLLLGLLNDAFPTKLGSGNMYVHVATFLLLCVAPFWICNIAALNIHNYVIGDVIGIAGVVLCAFGLLYGGFWRIQMRRRFRLPRDAFCFGSASLTDYVKWMFCWACALAQEVRTGNFYDVEDDSLFRKLMDGEEERQTIATETRDGSEVLRGDATTPPVQPLMGSEDVVGGANGSTQLPPASFSAGEEDDAPSST